MCLPWGCCSKIWPTYYITEFWRVIVPPLEQNFSEIPPPRELFWLQFLAHLSQRLTRWAYSIPMVRRPSVECRLPHFQTWIYYDFFFTVSKNELFMNSGLKVLPKSLKCSILVWNYGEDVSVPQWSRWCHLLRWRKAFSACDVRQTFTDCGIFSAPISCILLL